MLTGFERRQSIVELLRTEPGLRVPDIAKRLAVSQGTVRNDLKSLANEGRLRRVRGGATLTPPDLFHSPAFGTRTEMNEGAKRRIARWATELVQDGDSILLDASTTVYYMAPYLQDRRNLTIITNGIEVAQLLAQNPSNTVILVGGVLSNDGTSVTGLLGEHFLKDIHVKTAFVSCSGFTPEVGMTEVDIHEAQLKGRMVASATSVVGLIDSSKFGKVDLTPFARTEQLAHIFTDSDLAPQWVERLKQPCVQVTVCDEEKVSVLNRCDTE